MKIIFDGKELEASEGTTILGIARQQGIEIPTLCFLENCTPLSTSCLVCLVKADGKMVPACATVAVDGMAVESETDEVRQLRKASLELLLSDHYGDCYATCQIACPAKLDIPRMLRQIRDGNADAAVETVKETIPLPAVLGRVCPKPCEKVCRRKEIDSPVAICAMKRHVGDADLASCPNGSCPNGSRFSPKTGVSFGETDLPSASFGETGLPKQRVVVIGAGPSGLSAAFYLTRLGHRVELYGQKRQPGGRLRTLSEDVLPLSVLDAEIRTILSLPIDYYPEEHIDWTQPGALDDMLNSFAAVLLCTGPCDAESLERSGLELRDGRLVIGHGTFSTSKPGVFATGTLIRSAAAMIVRSVADGREAAESIDRFLWNGKPIPAVPTFAVKLGKLTREEIDLLADVSQDEPATDSDVARESARCLHCDCRGREKCQLLKHAATYRAETNRFAEGSRRPLEIRRSGDIVFEPGKCIKCGLCIAVSRDAAPGLAFHGRGFNVRIGVPFDEPLEHREAARICPTAALSLE